MFGELLESRAARRRNRGGMVVSIVGHALLVALAVAGTRTQLGARAPVQRIVPLPILHSPAPRPRDPAPAPARRTATSTPTAPRIPILSVPVIVPTGIPAIDLTQPVTTGDIPWDANAGLTAGIMTTTTGGGSGEDIPFAPGVDKPAIALPGNPTPRYPDILRRANVRGEVVIQVVIDTTGRADIESVRVLSSDHQLLTDAVLATLPRARFLPAEAAGRKVRMWAVQSFVFEVK